MNRLMRNKLKRLFDPSRPVYARNALIVEGLTYSDGDEIPWAELGVAQQDVEMWFRLRLISHFKNGDQSPEALEAYGVTTPAVEEKPESEPVLEETPVVEETPEPPVEEPPPVIEETPKGKSRKKG